MKLKQAILLIIYKHRIWNSIIINIFGKISKEIIKMKKLISLKI
jgi:hypothetical protein